MGALRYLTAGESHGECLTGILEGMPAGIDLVASRDIDPILKERQGGYGRGRRQQIEQDVVKIQSGVRFGKTLGSPIALRIENKDWANWSDRMSVEVTQQTQKPVTIPRPGHADYAGGIKYGHESDLRNVFERASARETAMRVALGAVALRFLTELQIEVYSQVLSIGEVQGEWFQADSILDQAAIVKASDFRTATRSIEGAMKEAIDRARADGDTLGGQVECIVMGCPVGLGSHVQWDRKIDARLAAALMSIQGIKAVEVGSGVAASSRRGSQQQDPFKAGRPISRISNHAGGIEGGMSNGEPIRLTTSMKPISTLMKPLGSVDLATGLPAEAHIERSDVCAVPALSVIVRAVTALTVAGEILETFGGDTLQEVTARVEARRSHLV